MHHAKGEMMRLLMLAALLAASAGCALTPAGEAVSDEIALDRSSVRLEGWFHAQGEWIVSAGKHVEDPADKPLNQRCVSVVNATGSARHDFNALDGKRVAMTGFVMDYEDIPIGPTSVDQIVEKRYYDGEPVFDTCRRRAVFIAKSIRLASP